MSSRLLSKRIGKLKAQAQKCSSRHKVRKLRLEALEDRRVMAVGPTLIGVIPNGGVPLSFAGTDVLPVAPRELLFRFGEGQSIDPSTIQQGIRVERAGFDGIFGDPLGTDVTIAPGFIGLGDRPREVVLRFAETLPNDAYRVTLFGAGPTPLTDTFGNPVNGGVNQIVPFRLDLGAQVTAVVPQPVTQITASGPNRLSQNRSQIIVYFNSDRLNLASAQNPAFYRLINSTTNVVTLPQSVLYTFDSALDRGKAVLQFSSNIADGFYELRIGTDGSNESTAVTILPAGSDSNSTFDAASVLGPLALGTNRINSSIDAQPYNITWPGLSDDPGHRDHPAGPTGEHHLGGGDGFSSASVLDYNFESIYGLTPQGNFLFNAITENQKQRAREIFELYSRYLGVTFRETPSSGVTVVTGDPRAVDATIDPLAVGGIFGGCFAGTCAIVNSFYPVGNSDYGGGWFETAMHEIGHSLGLGHSYELPPLTIQGDANVPQNSATPAEPVFPGDHDIVHGQTLFRPDSRDIDLYQFEISQAGRFTAEINAERNNSNLNSLLYLYREIDVEGTPIRELIARNDDYYSEDSYLELDLEPGTYYIGVMAAGMTEVDPNLPNSGFGGRSAGSYSLNLKQTPPPAQSMVDLTGTPIDGDADGVAGGTYSFWFQSNTAANTIFVDRARDTAAGVQGSGTLADPYDTLSAALAAAAASPGRVVRIVGNGDGNPLTAGELPYLLGHNDIGVTLRDGAEFRVPADTTVMIDAGAIIKMQGANLDAGSTTTNRARGAIQVLGTPDVPVWLTSYSDDTIGGDSDGPATPADGGDFGGIVFRDDSDREADGIFLNYVNHAEITFGGGGVVVDSVQDIYSPIHMIKARPTVSFNEITRSADAAISADPDSFDDSLGRIGPDIHGNDLVDNLGQSNSINGLLVRTRATSGNNALSIQTVFGRWNDTDITHVVTDNLTLRGQPGGRNSGIAGNKQDARLRIDPGVIVKLEGSRIEVGFGAQLIAEGTPALPILFTALRDDRFGASGTFDTNNDGATTAPAAGHWGGLFFSPNSIGSIDRAKIYFGGGTVPIEGGFDAFNAVEIHQADVRVANSFLESHASGLASTNRGGRGSNAEAVIFVRGAQPVIVNNVFRDSDGSVISINANSLQATPQEDYGRSTGTLGLTGGLFGRTDRFEDNFGPLVRLNRTGNNTINGMEVRGGTLTTETVWDDTDIVHVLLDEIVVLNHHVYSGIRLQSSSSESLVVKLEGDDAGFTANGVPLDMDDRIGGSMHIVGQPGHDVVLTSLDDCSAGAGFDISGQFQTETVTGECDTQQPIGNSGAVIVDGGDRDDFGHGSATAGPDGIIGTPDDINLDGWQFIEQMIAFTYAGARNNAPNDVLALGTTSGGIFGGALEAITSVTTVLGLNLTVATGNQISTVNFADYKVIYVPSNEFNTPSGITQAELDLLALRKAEIAQFVNTGGSLVALTDAESPRPYAWLELPLPFTITDFTAGGIDFPLRKTPAAIAAGFTISDAELSLGVPYHNDFTGPPGFNGLVPFVLDTGDDDIPGNADDRVITLGLASGSAGIGNPPRNWRSVRLDQYSNDRNVAITNELEAAYAALETAVPGVMDTNRTPQTAQFLGTLANQDKNGDDNRRLGFEIHGTIQHDTPHDVDVYSFNASAGTEVWIDVDRTAFSLDAIVELIDANGNVLARSLDEATLSGSALPFNKDSFNGRDTFSTNPLDPVMRVILPATPGGNGPYFVRIRSTPIGGSLSDIDAGSTSGKYQMQIRLQQLDEKPGSTVRMADIRFATNGIEVLGLPYHSPLLGESGEANVSNDAFASAQELGNLLRSDRSVISTAGALSGLGDVDFYRFSVDFDLIQVISGRSDGAKTWATMFDIDYADGLTRADLNLSVFDDQGRLIFVGRDSDVEDDQPGAGQGADTDDLSRGSFGKLDPYLGTVQLPAGSVGAGVTRTYYVAISSNRRLPQALNATFQSAATSPLIRLEPINSVRRIAEDHIGSQGGGTADAPQFPLFSSIDTQVTSFTLSNVNLFVSAGTEMWVVDPQQGDQRFRLRNNISNNVQDIVFRSDAHLYGTQGIPGQANDVQNLVEFNFSTGATTVIGDDDIQDAANPPANVNQFTSDFADAIAIRGNVGSYAVFIAARGPGRGAVLPETPASRLYRIDPTTGDVVGGLTGYIKTPALPDLHTTGMAFIGNQAYGVSDSGHFYRISTAAGTDDNRADIITQFPGVQFAGLARGPINVEGQAYRNLLFAITTDGTLYCLDTSGNLQPVFAGNATSISTGLSGVTGLAFSPIDQNLWHDTERRGADAGHGINPSPDNHRIDAVEGARSLWYGFENESQLGFDNHPNNQDLRTNPLIQNTYNTPGGTAGVITSQAFSLTGANQSDKPTIYFNYFLDTQNRDSDLDTSIMRDAARVHISTDGGFTWQLLTTNNSVRDTNDPSRVGELPPFASDSRTDHPLNTFQRVQELFDDTDEWRQARVDLSDFAGLSNLRLMFSFTTSGSTGGLVSEDAFAQSTDSNRVFEPAEQNTGEGFFVDDIIIGFAERGEMVTSASTGVADFFNVVPPVDPAELSDDSQATPAESLTGPYQLEIRRGIEYGVNANGVDPDVNLYRTFDTNARLIPSLLATDSPNDLRLGRGDTNFVREQGHIQIEQNYITNVSGVGILIDNGARGAGGSLPFPGAVRNLPTLNNERWFAGVTVTNNVVAFFGQAGINYSGDANPAGQTVAGVPFGRIVNNTVHGGGSGTGIQVTENASPSILNNIVSNTATGIDIDGTSASTVVGANLFAENASNGTLGSNPIILAAGDPLFVNPGLRNFYLKDNSLAIDSSLNSLADRLPFAGVKSPLGIIPSPILAPDLDALNQLRVDDPTQDPPPGLGSNIFKDRGAIERADSIGPLAVMKLPPDNDLEGLDQDLRENSVIYDDMFLDRFVVKFLDTGGIGVDDLLVRGARFLLTEDGVPLVQGVDYTFAYDANVNEAVLIPSNGVWGYRKTYVITIDNSPGTGIADLAGNLLQANQPDGTTQLTVFVGAPVDFGDAPDSPPTYRYPTLEASNGAGHKVKPGVYLGTGVTPDIDPLPTPNADGDTLDDGLISSAFRLSSTAGQIVVSASVAGKLDAWLDLNQDGDWGGFVGGVWINDSGEYIVSSATPLGQLVAGNNTLNFTLPDGGRGTSFLRLRFSTAGVNLPTGLAEDGEVEDYQVQLLGPPFQNSPNHLDVNNDGKVTPVDALLVINALNRFAASGRPGPFTLPYTGFIESPPPFLDVAAPFNLCTPNDALQVINFLNANAGPQGEGEADAALSATGDSTGSADAGVPAVLFASSSIVVETNSTSSATPSRRAIDDELFASDNLQFTASALSPISTYDPDVEDDREAGTEESWDEVLKEFDLGLLD